MKKIIYVKNDFILVHDSTDYIKIEKDGQYVDDKYINSWGEKINSYRYNLKKGRLIIRGLYHVKFAYDFYQVGFKKFRYYNSYTIKEAKKINEYLNTKNSFFDNDYINSFDDARKMIIRIFSDEMKLKINT